MLLLAIDYLSGSIVKSGRSITYTITWCVLSLSRLVPALSIKIASPNINQAHMNNKIVAVDIWKYRYIKRYVIDRCNT